MSKLNVIKFFKDKNFDVDIIELEDSATVGKAAESLGVNTNDIAKTLAFHVGNDVILVVMSGDARVDNKKFKETFNAKAKMLNFEEVQETIGHPVGGVCPFGVSEGVKIYLDVSLRDLEYVYPAAGEFNCALKIKPLDIEKLTKATWVDVCKLN
jgi:Cys-tRNA(Pro) deacylase